MASYIMEEIFIPIMGDIFIPIFSTGHGGGVVSPTTTFLASYYSGTEDDLKALVTGTGPASSVHTSTDHQPEHPSLGGTYRSFEANEEVFKWGRWVRNILISSDDLTDASYALNSATATEKTLTFTAATATARIQQAVASDHPLGSYILISAKFASEDAGKKVDFAIHDGSWSAGGPGVEVTIPSSGRICKLHGPLVNGSLAYIAMRAGTDASVGKTLTLVDGWQVEDVTAEYLNGGSPSEWPPAEHITTTTAPVTKVFMDTNGNTVASNVVTELPGIRLVDPEPEQIAHEGGENAQIKSNDQSDAEYTKTNGTAAKTETGLRADTNGSCLLTATSANFVCMANAITAASNTHATKWFLKRKTGTGVVELTVDGTTWQPITVTDTALFLPFAADQATVTNPQAGIRIVTSGDEIIVGNAESHLNKAITDIVHLGAIFTEASPIPLSDISNTWPQENHVDEAGNSIEIDYQGGAIDVLSLGGTAFMSVGDGGDGVELVDTVIDASKWVATGSNIIEDAADGFVKISYVDHADGGYIYLTDTNILSRALGVGEQIAVTYAIKVDSGTSARVSFKANPTVNGLFQTDTDPKIVTTVILAKGANDFITGASFDPGDVLYIKILSVQDVATTIRLQDGQNMTELPITTGRQTIGWVADTSKMQLLVDGTFSAETTFDGSFGSGEIECYLPSWRFQGFTGGTYDQQKQLVLEESYTVLVADTGEILTAEDGTTILIGD